VAGLGRSHTALHSFHERLKEPHIFDEMRLDVHMSRLLIEALSDTWFGTEGIEQVPRSTRGTKPGDLLAVMIFCLLMAKVDKQITMQLQQAGLLEQIPWNGSSDSSIADAPLEHTTEAVDVNYEDDATYLLIANTPAQCLSKVKATAQILVDTFVSYSLIPNMQPGKTKCVMKLRGYGSNNLNHQLFIENDACILVKDTALGDIRLVVAKNTNISEVS
jgi:hypothetical protein